MPLSFIEKIHPHLDIAVWDIEESVQELRKPTVFNDQEEKELEAISHERSKKQWLASNLLRSVLKAGNKVIYSPLGVPSLKDNALIFTLSHSEFKVALSSNTQV